MFANINLPLSLGFWGNHAPSHLLWCFILWQFGTCCRSIVFQSCLWQPVSITFLRHVGLGELFVLPSSLLVSVGQIWSWWVQGGPATHHIAIFWSHVACFLLPLLSQSLEERETWYFLKPTCALSFTFYLSPSWIDTVFQSEKCHRKRPNPK